MCEQLSENRNPQPSYDLCSWGKGILAQERSTENCAGGRYFDSLDGPGEVTTWVRQ